MLIPKTVSSLVLLVVLCATGCVTNPETGRNQLNLLSEPQEIAIGTEAAPKFLRDYGGPIPSQPIRAYVSELGLTLARTSTRPHLPWEFHVMDSSVINAFTLPGGKVFISRALLKKMENEAQLAGALGHEIGHITARHVNDRMVAQTGTSLLLIGAGIATSNSDDQWMKILGVGAETGGTIFLLRYGREQELEADEIGVKYMARNGYDPRGQIEVMKILQNESGGGRRGAEMLSTHPLPESRIRRLDALIGEKYSDVGTSDRYQFHADRFESIVRRNLAGLPPPKHTGKTKRVQPR